MSVDYGNILINGLKIVGFSTLVGLSVMGLKELLIYSIAKRDAKKYAPMLGSSPGHVDIYRIAQMDCYIEKNGNIFEPRSNPVDMPFHKALKKHANDPCLLKDCGNKEALKREIVHDPEISHFLTNPPRRGLKEKLFILNSI